MARPRKQFCGTRSGYQRHKRAGEEACVDCTAANARSKAERQRRRRVSPDALAVTCWCEGSVVFVSPRDVFEGRTGSCGASGCAPEAVAS